MTVNVSDSLLGWLGFVRQYLSNRLIGSLRWWSSLWVDFGDRLEYRFY